MAAVGQIHEHDVFTCPICLETLKSPKSLPCLHTFCETCIGDFILSTEQRAEQNLSKYPCPVCRTVVTPANLEDKTSQWAASLPHNFTISSLIDGSQSVKQECDICKRRDKISEATQWCCDCTEAFCEHCLEMHSLMKLFADHQIIIIEEKDTFTSVDEPDLSMISDLCPVHTSKVLEAFCFDHQELCCVLCLTLQHRKCEQVQAIEEMQNLKNVKMSMLLSEVNAIKVKVEKVMKEKNGEKEKLDTSFTEIEAEANRIISTLKDKLDSMLALFIKGLSITHEESGNAFENKLKTFENLSKYFDKLECSTKKVKEHGTLNQMFVHFEKSKTEVKSFLTAASSVLNTSSISEAKLVKSAKLVQFENIDSLFELESIKAIPVDLNAYVKQLLPSVSSVFSKTHPFSSFDSIILKYVKAIDLNDFDVYSGVFVSDEVIVVGGQEEASRGKTSNINILNGTIVEEYTYPTVVKRLAFDFESGSLFVSCYESNLYHFELMEAVRSKIKTRDSYQNNGGIFEIVCTTLDGREIFKYKDEYMKKTTSLCAHSEGLIFVGDENGSIHLISEDGCRRRTVLNSSDIFKTVRDICLDKSCSRLAVFGPGYIDLYDVCTGSR